MLAKVNQIDTRVRESNTDAAIYLLKLLRDELAEGVLNESAVKSGQGAAVKVLRDLLKFSESQKRKPIAYPWLDSQGRQCVTDGYRAFRVNSPLPLPARPDDAGPPVDLDSLVNPSLHTIPIDVPAPASIKAFIETHRAAYKVRNGNMKGFLSPIWDFGPGLPAVNAAYLLDLLTVMPDATLTAQENVLRPIYCASSVGDALLLPVRKNFKDDSYAKLFNALDARIAERGDTFTPDEFEAAVAASNA